MVTATYPIAETLEERKIRWVEANGARTRYYEDGTGEPLVLIHGGQFGIGSSLDDWTLNLPALAARFHVYAFDKLGQGRTDNPKTDADYTFERVLEHAFGFFRALGIAGAHVVGHSRGGLLAACLALEHPRLLKTAVLVNSATLAPEDPRFPSDAFYADLARRTPPGPPTREIVRMMPEALSYRREHLTEEFIARLLDIALLPKTQEARRRMLGLRDPVWNPSLDRWRERALREIDQRGLPAPTLVIWGHDDPSAPLPLGLQLYDRICAKTRQAELCVLNQAGHVSFRDQPDAFNRVVTSFCLDPVRR